MKVISPSQLDMNNPGTWPIIYKILLWLLIVAGILFLYNQFLRTPILEEQAQNNQQIENFEAGIQDQSSVCFKSAFIPKEIRRINIKIEITLGLFA